MKCHDAQRMISDFIEKKLTDQQLEGFLEHIETCQNCYDELEVYYMITIGLRQLDEDHTGTMDLKRNLKDFLAEQERELLLRKKIASRRRLFKRAGIALLLIVFVFSLHTLMFSEKEIHSFDDFTDAATLSLYTFWFGEDALSEPVEPVSEPNSREYSRFYFEKRHPVLLPAGFSVEDRGLPERNQIKEKGLIIE